MIQRAAPLSDIGRAALWMLGAVASFSSMALAGRAVSLSLDTFEIMTWRSVIGLAIVLILAGASGHLRRVRRQKLGLHMLRNVAHFTGQNLWFFAVATIPLAQVFALEFTTPIWALLLAAPILGERITGRAALAAAAGFVGVLIVARPSPETLSPGVLAAAAAGIAFGLTAVLTRRLTRTEGITSILFWLTLMQAVMGLAMALADGHMTLPSRTEAPFLLIIAVAGLTAHFCLTTALSLAPAGTVMPIDFLRLPLIAVLGMLVFAEPFDPVVLLGGALIFAATYVTLARPARVPQG